MTGVDPYVGIVRNFLPVGWVELRSFLSVVRTHARSSCCLSVSRFRAFSLPRSALSSHFSSSSHLSRAVLLVVGRLPLFFHLITNVVRVVSCAFTEKKVIRKQDSLGSAICRSNRDGGFIFCSTFSPSLRFLKRMRRGKTILCTGTQTCLR